MAPIVLMAGQGTIAVSRRTDKDSSRGDGVGDREEGSHHTRLPRQLPGELTPEHPHATGPGYIRHTHLNSVDRPAPKTARRVARPASLSEFVHLRYKRSYVPTCLYLSAQIGPSWLVSELCVCSLPGRERRSRRPRIYQHHTSHSVKLTSAEAISSSHAALD